MNSSKVQKKKFLRMAIVSSLLSGLITIQGSAQVTGEQTSMPAEAPSFLKQAGQKLFDSAQKRVIQNLNDKLQQQNNPTVVPGQSPLDPNQTSQAGLPPGTMPPGTMPPGTMPPGTMPPGTMPPGTMPPTAPGAMSAALINQSTQKQLAPCRSWVRPGEKPVACLLCVHGLGLQSNSYEFFGNELSKRGLAVYAIDVRGFGAWMQAKGKSNVNFDECLQDIKQALESIKQANPNTPVYVLGESMGGAIALRAASMYPDLVDGLISSVPAGERFNQGKTSMKVFMNLLSGFNLANVGNDIVNQATKSQRLKSQWQEDPLARLNLTPEELIQFQNFMNFNHEAAKKLTDMPVLFVQGIGDQLVKPEGTWELFNSVASKDKSFFAVPGEHLIIEEAQTQDPTQREQNFRVISSWLTSKVGRRHRRAGGSSYGYRQNQDDHKLDAARQMINNGQYFAAITELEKSRGQRPDDAEVQELLAKAYYQAGQPEKAGHYFRSSMRLSRGGGAQASELNSYMLDMSRKASQPGSGTSYAWKSMPFAGFGNYMQYLPGKWGQAAAAAYRGPVQQGKVLAFYADWAEQCKSVKTIMSQMASTYGRQLEIRQVNIEDPSSDALIEQYKVGPIPTVIFVAPNGEVNSTIIGASQASNYDAAIKALLQPVRRR